MATTTAIANNNNNSTIITNDGGKPLVKDLHEHIVCPLCRGYLIDATTLVECLHSFCRGCIVRRLGSGARACPVCGALTLPPLLPDLALQRLVYMAVPGLYRSELERRRHFRLVNPQCPPPAPPLGGLTLTMEDPVSLSLCEILNDDQESGKTNALNTNLADEVEARTTLANSTTKSNNNNQISGRSRPEDRDSDGDRSSPNKRLIRYLKCPAGVTVRHLVRLLALKRGWGDTDGKFTLKNIEMLYQNGAGDAEEHVGAAKNSRLHRLQLSWTLLDLACIFKWDKETPMKLFYRVVKREEPLLQPPSISTQNVIGTNNNNTNNNNNNNNNNSIVTGNSKNGGMENVQRPPTPPPSPKQSSNNSDIRTQPVQHQPKTKSKSDHPKIIESAVPTESRVKEAPSVPNESDKIREIPAVTEPEKSQSSSSSSNPNSNSNSSAVSSVSANQTKNCSPEMASVEAQNGEKVRAPNSERDNHGVKVKKPRCEVTPVMRAPGFHGSCTPAVGVVEGNNRSSGKVPRMEHHKRRKRRNKRLIAEITTTPREDLLKLKVRLTPCPPRITSSTAGSAKEKLLQMRAVRREKIKNNNDRGQTPPPTPAPTPALNPLVVTTVNSPANSPEMPLTPPPSASAEIITAMPIIAGKNNEVDGNLSVKVVKSKEIVGDVQEETIEDIIDGIPDEVVRVAQNLNSPATTTTLTANLTPEAREDKAQLELRKREELAEVKNASGKKKRVQIPEVHIISDEDDELEEEEEILEEEDESSTSRAEVKLTLNKPKKDEEVLRRLGLVAISEASKTLQDKIRGSQKSGGSGGAGVDYNRETLERQLRESKANRVRSLLAEKQMRDALKSIMSKSKGPGTKAGGPNGPKKGPPPLAPLTPKQGFPSPPKSSHPTASHQQIIVARGSGGKIEKPLDLSSGANNALDLSPATPSSSVNPPVITSTTFSNPVVKSRGKNAGAEGGKKSLSEEKKNQDNLNLRTLSDAAVSLLGTGSANCLQSSGGTGGDVRIANSTILSNKVALRIPQYHNRIGGFGNGMKIKPNLAVRHIPNPQAFVASQYVRNQRTTFFNAQQQQPP